MKRDVAVSLILHLSLLAAAILWARPKVAPVSPPRLMVEVLSSPGGRAGGRSGGSGPGAGAGAETGGGAAARQSGREKPRARATPPPLRLGLVPRSGDAGAVGDGIAGGAGGGSGAKGGPGTGRGEGGGDGFDSAEAMDLKKEGELFPFFQQLWKKIDAAVGYPPDLVRQRLTGRVSIHVEVDRRGVFTGRFPRVEGDDPVLRAYVLAMVIHALRQPLRENHWNRDGSSVLIVDVSFRNFGPGDPPEPERIHFFKNILSLKRESQVEPLLNEKFEQLVTRYLPPIIPVPGGVIIDFYRLYQLVQNYGTPTPEDRRASRIEATRERWESVFRQASEGAPPATSQTDAVR